MAGVVFGIAFAIAILVAFRMSAQLGAESLRHFTSRRSQLKALGTNKKFIGGLRICIAFGSVFYPPMTANLIVCEDELILTPSILAASIFLPTWAVPFSDICLVENAGNGVRVFVKQNSEAFTFISSRFLEVLQALNDKSVPVQWNVVKASYWTGKRLER